jgi:hypothetical protein
MVATMSDARSVVEDHLAAFNAHDAPRLLAGFAEDAIWATGQDVMRGREALADLFDESLWKRAPSLTTLTIIAVGNTVAAELHERITVDGVEQAFDIAAFFVVTDGLIRRAKVYREGTADVE